MAKFSKSQRRYDLVAGEQELFRIHGLRLYAPGSPMSAGILSTLYLTNKRVVICVVSIKRALLMFTLIPLFLPFRKVFADFPLATIGTVSSAHDAMDIKTADGQSWGFTRAAASDVEAFRERLNGMSGRQIS